MFMRNIAFAVSCAALLLGYALDGSKAWGAGLFGINAAKNDKSASAFPSPVVVPDNIDTRNGYADLVEKLLPTVVNISVSGTKEVAVPSMGGILGGIFSFGFPLPDADEQQMIKRETTSLGSGFIIDSKGLVVTNYHVIKDADKIIVTTHDGSEFRGKVLGKDENMDIALVQLDSKRPMPFVRLGNTDNVRIGDRVIAIGNPMGLGGTVTTGVVSAKSRCVDGSAPYAFVQTDAILNHGSSGGPMFNLKGEAIGMNTAIMSNERGGVSIGLGFAIPADVIVTTVNELKHGRSIERPWLGIAYRPMDDKFAAATGAPDARGILVHSVVKDSPADKAGIKPDDIIVSFNGSKLTKEATLSMLLTKVKIGQVIPMSVWRFSAKKFVDIKLAMVKKPKAQEEDAKIAEISGIVVGALDDVLRSKLHIPAEVHNGVIVKKLSKQGTRRDLRRNDVVTAVNAVQIMSPSHFKAVIQRLKKEQEFVVFHVIRNGTALTLAISVKE